MLEGSPAHEAGLQLGDAIVKFGSIEGATDDVLAAVKALVEAHKDQQI